MLLDPDHDTRWYERRKRSLVLDSLARPHYSRVFEPACGHGRLTAELARRSHGVIAMDPDPRALASTRDATAGALNVEVRQGYVPNDWPLDRAFDLIVLSEFLYYLPVEQLPAICDAALHTLDDGGEILACHWRHPITESTHSAGEIHDRCAQLLGLACYTQISDADFVLHVWGREPKTVAQRDGLVP